MTLSERVRATICTEHEESASIASSIRPDNTTEMETAVDENTVRTTIERDTTGGAHATADDYVVNLIVAAEVVQHGRSRQPTQHEFNHE